MEAPAVTVESAVCRGLVVLVVLMDPGMLQHGALSPVVPVVMVARVVKVAAAAVVAVVPALVFTSLAKVDRTLLHGRTSTFSLQEEPVAKEVREDSHLETQGSREAKGSIRRPISRRQTSRNFVLLDSRHGYWVKHPK